MTESEILRIKTARNTIRTKLVALGLAESTDKIDELATVIDDIANNGAVSASISSGGTYTVPAGYHNGSGTVSCSSDGGSCVLQSKTVTPTKSQQTVSPDSDYDGLSSVVVNAIPEAYQNVSSVTATASDVLSGKTIVTSNGTQTTGTMTNRGAVSGTISTKAGTYTIPAGYHSGSGSVSISSTEQSKIIADNIKSGISILGVTGTYAPYVVLTGSVSLASSTSVNLIISSSSILSTMSVVSLGLTGYGSTTSKIKWAYINSAYSTVGHGFEYAQYSCSQTTVKATVAAGKITIMPGSDYSYFDSTNSYKYTIVLQN